MKAGIGYDAHRFSSRRKLMLGGIQIPFNKGLSGHSDADALLHSLCDAILGALGKGDIGIHFPDTDNKYKGISSLILLESVVKMLKNSRKKIVNADICIIAEEPKLSGYFNSMKAIISKTLGTKSTNINIKATKNEKMGFIGNAEGIAVFSIVLIN